MFKLQITKVHSFSMYEKFSEKLNILTTWYAHVPYQGVRNASFSEYFAYLLNE